MLESSDELGLGLEPADELGIVREVGVDRLHRDVTLHLRLDRPVDDAERTLADLLEQSVAAQRLALQVEVGVLAKDAFVEQPQLA